MRSSVILNEDSNSHFVENYRFKVLGVEHKKQVPSQKEEDLNLGSKISTEDESAEQNLQDEDGQNIEQSNQNGASNFDPNFVEELLRKTDELSGNMIKLQMQIENQESEFNKRLEDEIARAKEDGRNEGIIEAKEGFDNQLEELTTRFNSSIEKLTLQYDRLDEFLLKNETELGDTALDISRQVIQHEISEKSSKIAFYIATSLLKDLKQSQDIVIRVNPDDSKYIHDNFEKNTHIKVEADDAISKGGVVIISETNNIDATLQTRLEKVKSLMH